MPRQARAPQEASIQSICQLLASAHDLMRRMQLGDGETEDELKEALNTSRLSAARLLAERQSVRAKQR